MMIANDVENKRWVNGTVGTVSKLDNNAIEVTIDDIPYEVSNIGFSKNNCRYNREKNTLEYYIEASVSQYPVILAYAITIHKSKVLHINN